MKATAKMYNLQEIVRKVYLNGLVNSGIIEFSNNTMLIRAIGVEDSQGVVDGELMLLVKYPVEVIEDGKLPITSLQDFLSKLELFERDDDVTLSTTEDNKFVIVRETPRQVLSYDLGDEKYIKSYPTGITMDFDSENGVKLAKPDGKVREIPVSSTIMIDAQKLKAHFAKIMKIKGDAVKLTTVENTLTTAVSAETSKAESTLEEASVEGEATAQYNKHISTIVSQGIGNAILRFSDNSPIHIRYTHESMKVDYLLQVLEE